MAISSLTQAQLLPKTTKKRQALQRYGWKMPLCRDITQCGCGGSIGSGSEKSGVISVGEVDAGSGNLTSVPYGLKQTCMWHITVPKKHKIYLEFDRDYGFDVEYHNFCGFDKLHLFKGHFAPHQDVERIGRFCGPRPNYDKPWDGSRKIFSLNKMPFWDKAYNSNTNKITVAWDSDQTKSGMKGWKLKWWAVAEDGEEARPFDTLVGSMKLMRGMIEPLIRDQLTLPHRVRDRQITQLHNVLNKLETAVEEKGPNGEKSCSDMKTFVPPDDKLSQILSKQHTLERWLSKEGPIVRYANYYIGKCKNYKWDERVSRIYQKTSKNLGRARALKF